MKFNQRIELFYSSQTKLRNQLNNFLGQYEYSPDDYQGVQGYNFKLMQSWT